MRSDKNFLFLARARGMHRHGVLFVRWTPLVFKGIRVAGFMPDAGYRWRLRRRGGIGIEDADLYF